MNNIRTIHPPEPELTLENVTARFTTDRDKVRFAGAMLGILEATDPETYATVLRLAVATFRAKDEVL